MKKVLFVFTVITTMFLAGSANAQYYFSYGAKAGVNFSDLTDLDETSMRVGYHVGLIGRANLTDMIAIQPEILFSTKGSKVEFKNEIAGTSIDAGDVKLKMNYIDVPIKFVYNATKAFELQVGPYVSFLVSDPEVDTDVAIFEGTDSIDKDNFKTVDYGIVAGVAYNYNTLFVSASYNYGFAGVGDVDDNDISLNLSDLDDAKNSVIRVSVGMRF